ncbi:MAG: alpha-N-arabinofuranosidase [Candidatus Latescibacterota bacterium]
MTESVHLKADPAFAVGQVDPRLYGGFVEHMGRCVYTGIYEPGHATADADGFRGDVAALVRDLGMPVMRYPGGNFVSQYDWVDGIGPCQQRPTRLDLAWKATEPNQVGVEEYMTWCRLVGTEPVMAVNLGTRGPQEARDLVEYCNFAGGSAWSQRRAANGHIAPHGVKMWCLGNEMDGPWQACAKTATEYGRLARESAKLMRWVDGSIELVVCGSSNGGMATFGSWEWEVLGHTYDQADYLAIHSYFGRGRTDDEFRDYLASPEQMGRFIDQSVALCDAVGARHKSSRKLMVAYDEWNVVRPGKEGRRADDEWAVGRRLAELEYDVADAVVFGGLLVTLLNHADRAKVGCLAQTVNVLGPIMTEPGGPAWRQTIYHPFALTSRLGRGTALRVAQQGPRLATASAGEVSCLLAAAVHDAETGSLSLFLVNRDPVRPLDVRADVSATGASRLAEAWRVGEDDACLSNTLEAPDAVVPRALADVEVGRGTVRALLAPMSWSVVRVEG